MNHKQKQIIKDVIFMIILVIFMLFVVKGLPALMGGAQDANGNPLIVAQTAALLGAPLF